VTADPADVTSPGDDGTPRGIVKPDAAGGETNP
jgi:hypothetical protein